jgi:hypothetical protein
MKTTSTIANIANIATNAAIAIALATGLQAAGKTVKFGDNFLGATLAANMSYYTPTQGGYCDFYTEGRATGMVFYDAYNLASGAANFRINSGSTGGKAWGHLKAGSKTLASWNKVTTGTVDFSTAPIVNERTAGFDFFGIVELEAGISSKLAAEGKVTCTTNKKVRGFNGFIPATTVVTATCGPSVDVAVIGRGYLDLLIAWGGIYGEVSLCKLGLNATATMTPSNIATEFNTSNVNYALNFRTTSLSGKLKAWGDSSIPFVDRKEKTYSWTGITSDVNLGSGSFKIKKQLIVTN